MIRKKWKILITVFFVFGFGWTGYNTWALHVLKHKGIGVCANEQYVASYLWYHPVRVYCRVFHIYLADMPLNPTFAAAKVGNRVITQIVLGGLLIGCAAGRWLFFARRRVSWP